VDCVREQAERAGEVTIYTLHEHEEEVEAARDDVSQGIAR
jgi:hypothetical protein